MTHIYAYLADTENGDGKYTKVGLPRWKKLPSPMSTHMMFIGCGLIFKASSSVRTNNMDKSINYIVTGPCHGMDQ